MGIFIFKCDFVIKYLLVIFYILYIKYLEKSLVKLINREVRVFYNLLLLYF